MDKRFTVLVNDLKIKCKKKVFKKHFPEFYNAAKEQQDLLKIQIQGAKEFYELTKDIFQGKDYEITNDNIEYILDLEKQLKSDELHTRINQFYYKRECNENQIDQHPSIQFLVEFSTLIHKLNISNCEDITSQILQKLDSNPNNNWISAKSYIDYSDQSGSDNSDQDDNESDEESSNDKSPSLNKIPINKISKLFYYEIVNTLFTGINSIQQLQEHQQKVDLIVQIIKGLDTKISKNSKKSKDQKIYLNNFIEYVIKKYSKLKNQKSSISNYRQETFYLVHYLLSNKLIKISQIFEENELPTLYFLEFFPKEQIDAYLSANHPAILNTLMKKEEEKDKKSKKNKPTSKDENSIVIDLLSKSLKSGIIEDDQYITTFLNDDIDQFKNLFASDEIDKYKFPSEIADLSCLSTLNEITLIELSAFFGSQKIFDYLNKMRHEDAIVDPDDLYLYVLAGQKPQIIKTYFDEVKTKEEVFDMLTFCVSHHFFETYKMIMNQVGERLRTPFNITDEYMMKCVSRGYFEFIPLFLKEGATMNLLLNLFCKANNGVGIEYVMQFSCIDVNSGYQGKAPLEYCLDNKNPRATLLLVQNDYINMLTIDDKTENNVKIIHTACKLGLSKVVSYLLKKHLYDVNLPTNDGTCPIHFACLGGDYKTVLTVIRTKKLRLRAKVTKGKYKKQTALHFACRSGNPKVISLLLDTDLHSYINVPDAKGRTPIIYAVKNDFVDSVSTLLEQDDIDIDAEYKHNNLLQYACLKNSNKVFELILDEIVFDPNQPCHDGRVILVVAIENNNVEMIRDILTKFGKVVDINITTKNNKTPLIIACENNNTEIVRLLLKNNKIDVNKANTNDGNTPFLIAAKNGNVDVLKLLLQNKNLDIKAQNNAGMAAIHMSFFAQKIEAVKLLIPLFKDNLNYKAGNGETLLQMAYKRNLELAKLLMNQPEVDVNFKYDDGMTPLLLASKEGNLEVVKMLVESDKCDLDAKSDDDENAFVIAVENQRLPLVEYFIELYTNANPKEEEKQTKTKSKNKTTETKKGRYVDIKYTDTLLIALEKKNKDILKVLINCHYIDINQLSSEKTFMCDLVNKMLSANSYDSFPYNEIYELALARGDVDINKESPGYQNQACLHIACSLSSRNTSIKIVNQLLKMKGIDINKDSDVGSPLYLLIQHNGKYFNEASYKNNDDYNYNRRWGYSSINNYNDNDNNIEYWGDLLNNPELDPNKGGNPSRSSRLFRELFEVRNILERSKNEVPFENLPAYFHKPKRSTVQKKKKEIDERIKINEEKLKSLPKIESPLEMAIENKNYEIAKALVALDKLDINNNSNPMKQTPLHLAFNQQNADLINKILERKDVKLGVQDVDGNTPLMFALKSYDQSFASVILNLLNKDDIVQGINVQNNDQVAPLLLSVYNPNQEIFDKIISLSNVDFEVKDKKERTALYWLVKKVKIEPDYYYNRYRYGGYNNSDDDERTENQKKRIDYSQRINEILSKCPSLLNIHNIKNKTPLFKAIKRMRNKSKDMISVITTLLNYDNIDVSIPEDFEDDEEEEEEKQNEEEEQKVNQKIKLASLLHIACNKEIPRIVEKLISLTIKFYKEKYPEMSIFTQKNSSGDTILNVACNSNDCETIQVIIDFIINPENGINYNDPNVFDINTESSRKISPLLSICQSDSSYIARDIMNGILSIESLDINSQSTYNKRTALHCACENSNNVFVDLIVNKKHDSIDPNIYDNDNCTPLLIAVQRETPENVETLLKLDSIDVNKPRLSDNKTALYITTENSNVKIASLLLNDERTDPNIQTKKHKSTALMCSIEYNRNDIFKLILANEKTDISIEDKEKLNALHYACKFNNFDFVVAIIEKIKARDDDISKYLNKQARNGLTPLHYACLNNNEKIVQLLISFDSIDPNCYDKQGRTPLLIATIDKYYQVAKLLLSHPSINVNLPLLTKNKTPLYFSCQNWDDDIFEALITHPGIDPNIPKTPSLKAPLILTILKLREKYFSILINHENIKLRQEDRNKRTALHYACMKGNLRFIEGIISKCNQDEIGYLLNCKTDEGLTPFHYACKSGNKEAILYMLNLSSDPKNKVDIMIQNNMNLTPFDIYLNNPAGIIDEEICNMFMNTYKKSITTNVSIHDLNDKGHYRILKFIVQNLSFDINDNNNKEKITLLHFICKNQVIDLLKEMLKSESIDINLVDVEQKTPLHYAVIYGTNDEVVQSLIEKDGCIINAKDKFGNTALHYACQLAKFKLIEVLCKYEELHPNSIGINEQNESGSTALHILAQLKEFEPQMNEALLKANCDPNIVDEDGNTPLHIACINHHYLFVSSLIENSLIDIDPNIINNKYQTPLCIIANDDDSFMFDTLFNSKLKDKIDINLTSPILAAAINDSLFLCQKLFDMKGIDLNSNKKELPIDPRYIREFDLSGINLMHVISTFDSPEFLAKIIKSGKFDCNEKTDPGYDFEINGTPLIIALKNKRFDNFDLILNHYKDKLDLKLTDSEGKSVVDYCKEFPIQQEGLLQKLHEIDESIELS